MSIDLSEMSVQELRQLAQDANEELRKRERDQANAGRANFLNDTKFKKLVAKYRKALERVEELAKEGQKFTVTLPITFTLDTETYEEHGYVRPFGRLADVYSNSVTNAKIAKVPELSKAQLESSGWFGASRGKRLRGNSWAFPKCHQGTGSGLQGIEQGAC